MTSFHAVVLATMLGTLVGCGGEDATDMVSDAGEDTALADSATSGDSAIVADDSSSSVADAADADVVETSADAAAPVLPFLSGTNLSGAEFGPRPGMFGKDYTYPTNDEVDTFVGKGFTVFRIPFLWERLQPSIDGPLDATELGRLSALVTHITSKGARAVLDVHNYARYAGKVVGSSDSGAPTAAQFAAFWKQLATKFMSDERVVFGLMNEPHDMMTTLWLADANAAIAAIRDAGAKNLILVPGTSWTGAHSWVGTDPQSNGTVMVGVTDPGKNFAYEMHQYLDSDSSGTHAACVSATIGRERLVKATEWLKAHGARAFLGEFGASSDATCLAAVDDMLTYVDEHRTEWIGWSWWSAGPWWGDYMYSIEPKAGVDRPQLAPLVKHE